MGVYDYIMLKDKIFESQLVVCQMYLWTPEHLLDGSWLERGLEYLG